MTIILTFSYAFNHDECVSITGVLCTVSTVNISEKWSIDSLLKHLWDNLRLNNSSFSDYAT